MFKYETPPWGAKLVCFVYLTTSCFMLFAFSTYGSWAGNSPVFLKYIFLILGLLFLLPALKPTNWQGFVYFTADNNGLNFPTSFNEANNKSTLCVAWKDVGLIKSETLYSQVKGVSIELNISQTDINSHFENAALTNKLLGFDQTRGDFFVIAYANNAFQRVSSVVTSLNEIKHSNI